MGLFGGLIVFGLGLRGELVVSELLYSPSAEEGGERGEYLTVAKDADEEEGLLEGYELPAGSLSEEI